jgi:hypothetical protein
MIVKLLIIGISLLAIVLIGIISYVLMEDTVDPITKKSVKNKSLKAIGILGYLICCAISFGLLHYLNK